MDFRSVGGDHLFVAVNLSSLQFRQPAICQHIGEILEDVGLDPSALDLEITESTVMKNEKDAIQRMHALRSIGLRLSLDDFGTGYSSLSYLKRFPLNTLKIDRSFVRDIGEDRDDRAITAAIIDMAHHLGLKVIGEGVETEAQHNFLRQERCDALQGYLFYRPMPFEQAVEVVRDAQPQPIGGSLQPEAIDPTISCPSQLNDGGTPASIE